MRPSMPARKRCPCFERPTLLVRGALGGLAPAPLGDTLGAHARGGQGLHIGRRVEPAVARVEGGDAPEGGLVLGERWRDVDLVAGIAVQHTVVRDEAVATLRQKHLVAELDRALHLAALDEIRVGFEDREDLLVHGELFTLEHPALGLRDDAISQATEVLDRPPGR